MGSPTLFAPGLCTADWLHWIDPRGRHWLTIVAKITLELRPDDTARVGRSPRLLGADEPSELGTPEIEVPSDRVPFLARPEVMVSGFAFAPPGTRVEALPVSVALRGKASSFEKRLLAKGERDEGSPFRAPFSSRPLTWTHAVAGPGNPAGVTEHDRASLVDLGDPRRPAGLGPLHPEWHDRERHAFGLVREALDERVMRLVRGFDPRFFQAAPEDQWVETLEGAPTLTLRGLCPTRPELVTHLPEAMFSAVVSKPSGDEKARLVPDRLVIFSTFQRATLTFRGAVAVSPVELDDTRVVVGARVNGHTSWGNPADPAEARPHVLDRAADPESAGPRRSGVRVLAGLGQAALG